MFNSVIKNKAIFVEKRRFFFENDSFFNIYRRLLQIIAVSIYVLIQIVTLILAWPLVIYLTFTITWGIVPLAAYLIWLYVDRKACERGARRISWLQDAKIWKLASDYFPIELVKTADLPADKNYLLAVYPHGVVSTGSFFTFATNALNFKHIFKGITPHLCTLNINFQLPIIRELALAAGFICVSKSSLKWILSSSAKGKAAAVVVGGAEEARYASPGVFKIVLEKRKGFCKIALQNGAALVPVFIFGETDVFNVVTPKKDSIFEKFQLWVKKVSGAAPIFFFGSFGIFPYRTPITVVVGKPIEVEKTRNPTQVQIDGLHQKYKKSLILLFENEKYRYKKNPQAELIIV